MACLCRSRFSPVKASIVPVDDMGLDDTFAMQKNNNNENIKITNNIVNRLTHKNKINKDGTLRKGQTDKILTLLRDDYGPHVNESEANEAIKSWDKAAKEKADAKAKKEAKEAEAKKAKEIAKAKKEADAKKAEAKKAKEAAKVKKEADAKKEAKKAEAKEEAKEAEAKEAEAKEAEAKEAEAKEEAKKAKANAKKEAKKEAKAKKEADDAKKAKAKNMNSKRTQTPNPPEAEAVDAKAISVKALVEAWPEPKL